MRVFAHLLHRTIYTFMLAVETTSTRECPCCLNARGRASLGAFFVGTVATTYGDAIHLSPHDEGTMISTRVEHGWRLFRRGMGYFR